MKKYCRNCKNSFIEHQPFHMCFICKNFNYWEPHGEIRWGHKWDAAKVGFKNWGHIKVK